MILDLTYIQKTALQNSKSHSGMIKPPPPKEVDFQDELKKRRKILPDKNNVISL